MLSLEIRDTAHWNSAVLEMGRKPLAAALTAAQVSNRCIAGFQPADRWKPARARAEAAPADWKSAIQQTGSLRYGLYRKFFTFQQHWV